MKTKIKTALIGLGILLLQFFLSEYLAIKQIRPDFLLIYVIYVALSHGSYYGVIFGFWFGLFEDLIGVGSLFGLAPLTKSLIGFLMGLLKGKYSKMNPIVFHTLWFLIIVFHYYLYIYIRFQSVYEDSGFIFFTTWMFSLIYTLAFLGLFQLIKPIHTIRQID